MNDDKRPVPAQLKPFAKGDQRINRLGRPKHFEAFRQLAVRISHEKVIGPDGNTITRAEELLRRWAKSRVPALQLVFAAYCWGKPPEKIEVNELENKPVLILHYAHEFDRLQRERELQRPGDDNGEDNRFPLLPDAD